MPLNVETAGVVHVITLEGKIATEAAQDLKSEFESFTTRSPGPTLIDMTGVRYISSYLVGVFVSLRSRLSERGFEVHFAGMDSKQRFVLKVSALEDLFKYHSTRAEGIAAMAATAKPT